MYLFIYVLLFFFITIKAVLLYETLIQILISELVHVLSLPYTFLCKFALSLLDQNLF